MRHNCKRFFDDADLDKAVEKIERNRLLLLITDISDIVFEIDMDA